MDIKRIISVGVIAVVLAACASAQQSNIGGAAAKLQGDGSAITELNASNLTAGTVARERLPVLLAYGAFDETCAAFDPPVSNIECSRSGAGVYVLTISGGWTESPVCTVTPFVARAATFSIGVAAGGTVTNAAVTTYNAAGASVDSAFHIICIGN